MTTNGAALTDRPPEVRWSLPPAALAESRAGVRLMRAGLRLLPLGLLAGLALSLFAFQPIVAPPPGLARYDDLPRRLLRLAHIAAVMLPLINIVLGLAVDRLRLAGPSVDRAVPLLRFAAPALPLALAAEAAWAPLRFLHPSGVPALALCAGVLCLAAATAGEPGGRS